MTRFESFPYLVASKTKDFQVNLAAKLKIEMNAVLESLEDFGGIEAVYFTEFVVQ